MSIQNTVIALATDAYSNSFFNIYLSSPLSYATALTGVCYTLPFFTGSGNTMVVTQLKGPIKKAILGSIAVARHANFSLGMLMGLTLLVSTSLLSGCGQTGPLYLPNEKAPDKNTHGQETPSQEPEQSEQESGS